jgi:hypothetical protein
VRKFFTSNLERRGRVVRAILGLALVVTGWFISRPGGYICTCMVVSGGFVLFEAARGWCVMRACGIKTKL